MTETFHPPAGAATAAKRALRWIKEGHAGSGFTDVGRKRAAQLAAQESLSIETVKRMYSYFSRHQVDKQGKDFNNLEKPSPGRVAWDAWGGDAGFVWAKRIVESVEEKAVMATSRAQVYCPILKSEKQEDGSLLVTGIATDSSVDSDQQICDPEWLKSAMPNWFRWGNIREQHSHIAAGVAEEYEVRDGQHWVTARVVDSDSIKKVEARVLKGFSIGISSPRVIKDDKAAGGRIVDGEIVEISLVDRPANPGCVLSLAKAVGGELIAVEEQLHKREVVQGAQERFSEAKDAMSDGSYPIASKQDLKNAILTFGRAKDPTAVKRHIIRRAEKLGATDLLPQKWNEGTKAMEESEVTGEESAEKPGEASATDAPAEESTVGKAAPCKGCGKAKDACKCKEGGFEKKAVEESSQKPGEESSQEIGEESSRPGGVAGVAGKSADACPRCDKIYEMMVEVREKMFATDTTKSLSEDITKAVKDVEARVSDIEKTARTTVVPARTAVGKAATPAPNLDFAKAAEYRGKAMSTTDPRLAEGYLALAREFEKSL